MDNEELVENFLDDLNPPARMSYRYVLKQFLEHLDGKPLLEVRRPDIRSYKRTLTKRDLSSRTVKYHLTTICSMYNFFIDEEVLTNDSNPITTNPVGSIKKLMRSEKEPSIGEHQFCPTPAQAAELISNSFRIRDRAILTLLFKTGMRRHEASELDYPDSIDFDTMTIRIKPTGKRSFHYAYMDDELATMLKKWLVRRGTKPGPLFTGPNGKRLTGQAINRVFTKLTKASGIKTGGKEWTVHSTRYAFTTWLLNIGKMQREYVMKLRGDSIKSAIDIYDTIDENDLRKEYLRRIPLLGVV